MARLLLFLIDTVLQRDSRKYGYEIAGDGYSCDSKQDVGPRQDNRICLDSKMSGHLYEPQVLLEHGESYT